MNNSLKELANKVLKLQKDAQIVLSKAEPGSAIGIASRKRNAETQLPIVRKEYRDMLGKMVAPIVLVGSDDLVKSFIETTSLIDGVPVVVVDPFQFMEKELGRMWANHRSDKTFSPMQFEIAMGVAHQLAADYGFAYLEDVPEFKARAIKTPQDLKSFTANLLGAVCGGQLVSNKLLDTVADSALAQGFEGPILPTFIMGLSKDAVQYVCRLFSIVPIVVELETEDDTTEDAVVEVYRKVQQAAKGKKQ